MKTFLTTTISSISLFCLAAAPGLALAEEGYLYEVLENPQYRKTWDALIASQENVDSWLRDYSKTKNGPTTPSVSVELDDAIYQINFVCKTHDCGSNMFYVLFSPSAEQAWGLLLNDKDGEVYFGAPNAAQINALRKEANLLEDNSSKDNLSENSTPEDGTLENNEPESNHSHD